jgi:hypothetical protein
MNALMTDNAIIVGAKERRASVTLLFTGGDGER